jgi:hypothetical protein
MFLSMQQFSLILLMGMVWVRSSTRAMLLLIHGLLYLLLASCKYFVIFQKKKNCLWQSGITQLVRFLVVELTYPDLNSKFNMSVIFTANYFFSGS